jgi:hypothetical protein
VNLHQRYTGSGHAAYAVHPHAHHHVPPGHCRSCGHPSAQCCCGCRTCRKEAKELLVQSTAATGDFATATTLNATHLFSMVGAAEADSLKADFATAAAQRQGVATGTAFIGGGCCVHLSVEYTPVSPTAASLIGILVLDSEGTLLVWARAEKAGTHYQIKEGIITTKPGAHITVIAINMVARVRWCEVFSC